MDTVLNYRCFGKHAISLTVSMRGLARVIEEIRLCNLQIVYRAFASYKDWTIIDRISLIAPEDRYLFAQS